ncbi:hypothetical protein CKF58_04960 [Psittacicella hinzii]|uniref:Toprim domain-containing protein n=2 Tax=Psittacicella hinzii TaxID=2028575 RepID=A0A3A1YMI5_9GAMM|nr:hypothetical protein CKF58_04960 [Psittacicella hinzii]
MPYKRFFGVRFEDREDFKEKVKRVLNTLPYRAFIGCNLSDGWHVKSDNYRLQEADFSALADYLPEFDPTLEMNDVSDIFSWAKAKLDYMQLKVDTVKVSKDRNDWQRVEVIDGKRGNRDGGYVLLVDDRVTLMIVNYRISDRVHIMHPSKYPYDPNQIDLNRRLEKNKAYFRQKQHLACIEEIRRKESLQGNVQTFINAELMNGTIVSYKNYRSRERVTYLATKRIERVLTMCQSFFIVVKPVEGFGQTFNPGEILIPITDLRTNEYSSLQVIYPDGKKRFIKGYPTQLGVYIFNSNLEYYNQKKMILCEGFATGASIMEALWLFGNAHDAVVACCFSKGNLQKAAEFVANSGVLDEVVVVADNDIDENGNSKNPLPADSVVGQGLDKCRLKWMYPPALKDFDYSYFRNLTEKTILDIRVRDKAVAILDTGVVNDFNDLMILAHAEQNTRSLSDSRLLAAAVDRLMGKLGPEHFLW